MASLVTGLASAGPATACCHQTVAAEVQQVAVADAERAALAAGVSIRELHDLSALHEACRPIDRVWRPDPGQLLMAPELLLVFAHSGSYVVGVYQGEELVGMCLGLLATVGLHSHIAAVGATLRGRGVGHAVKLHQRAWALARSITTVTWTYDPLVGRNAHFNLAKLGALPDEYLADFYGTLSDGVNAGAPSDRLLVRWELTGERAGLAAAGHPLAVDPATLRGRAAVGLDTDPRGRPVVGRVDADTVLLRVPPDIETLRRDDPRAARDWRQAQRELLGGLLAERYAVTGFARGGWYVLERQEGLGE